MTRDWHYEELEPPDPPESPPEPEWLEGDMPVCPDEGLCEEFWNWPEDDEEEYPR